MSDLEEARTRIAEAEARADKAEVRLALAEVAASKGVPAELLTGATRDELEACADQLLEYRAAAGPRIGVHSLNQDREPGYDVGHSELGRQARAIFSGGPYV